MVQMDFLAANYVPCVYCRIVGSELKLEVALATIIDPERCKQPQNAYKWAGIALLTSPTGSGIIFGRPYYRSSLYATVSRLSVRLSVRRL